MFPHDKLDWHLSRLEKRLDDAPDDTGTRLEFATACLSKAWFHNGGEVWFNRALTQARRVLQHDPGGPGALVVAGASLVGLGRTEPAARYLDDALRIATDRADVHLAVGAMHEHDGERHQAIREFEMACRLAPDRWEPNYLLGRLLWARAQDLGGTKRLIERSQYHTVRALQLEPSSALTVPMVYHLGITCMHTGRFNDAHKLFSKLLDEEDYRVRAQYYLGLAAYQLGKYKNAVLFLRQHVKKVPDSPRVHARLGMCYLQLGEISKAREACNRALAVDPTDLQARWTLGCALVEEGNELDAVRTFKAILADAPDHAQAFNELVRIRTANRDSNWLKQALRSEVGAHDRLPLSASRDNPDLSSKTSVRPRQITRDRIQSVLLAMRGSDFDAVPAILEAMDLTTDEGLRFLLWDASLDHVAARRAREANHRLGEAGRNFSMQAGREVLALASALPEPLITRGLDLAEEDLSRAAVDRHGPAKDVRGHRTAIDKERREARAWQAMLLLALGSKQNRSSRSLLVRWASEADDDLADAARAGLAMLGDTDAIDALQRRAKARGAANLVDAMLTQVNPPRANFHPRPVTGDTELHCSTCGRRGSEVGHILKGGNGAVCDRCMTETARDRRGLESDDPALHCALCDKNELEARAVYAYRGVAICNECLDNSLGLLEREEIERYLAS